MVAQVAQLVSDYVVHFFSGSEDQQRIQGQPPRGRTTSPAGLHSPEADHRGHSNPRQRSGQQGHPSPQPLGRPLAIPSLDKASHPIRLAVLRRHTELTPCKPNAFPLGRLHQDLQYVSSSKVAAWPAAGPAAVACAARSTPHVAAKPGRYPCRMRPAARRRSRRHWVPHGSARDVLDAHRVSPDRKFRHRHSGSHAPWSFVATQANSRDVNDVVDRGLRLLQAQ